jgi:hypothetical protein
MSMLPTIRAELARSDRFVLESCIGLITSREVNLPITRLAETVHSEKHGARPSNEHSHEGWDATRQSSVSKGRLQASIGVPSHKRDGCRLTLDLRSLSRVLPDRFLVTQS